MDEHRQRVLEDALLLFLRLLEESLAGLHRRDDELCSVDREVLELQVPA